MNRMQTGRLGEQLAEEFLCKKGMQIIGRRFRVRGGEIDLVAKDGDEIVFVEVKTRRGNAFGYPEQSVDSRKLLRMDIAAQQFFIQHEDISNAKFRFDIVAVELSDKGANILHIDGFCL
ncbi:MAG: hypothetical protein ACD_76C00122G0005 [uncultured bacterium]|nr:MAG: hypothetical protein ACD_76C00122G0005 [uncultured bacterium]